MSAEPIHLRGEQYLLTVVKDTTKGRRTEAKLGRLSAVVERSKEAVLITLVDGTIAYVNPAFTEITGYTREQAVGKNPRFLQSGKQDAALYKDLWETILAGKIWHGEMTNRRQDGSLYVAGDDHHPRAGRPWCDQPLHRHRAGRDRTEKN